MITKQQALEFIDELSKSHKVFMDLEHGKFYVNTYITIDEDILGDYGFDKGGYISFGTGCLVVYKREHKFRFIKRI